MQNYRKTSHSVYDIKYHIVWVTKYRKQVLQGIVAERVRDLVRQICKENDVEIIKGHVSKDHVHLFVSVPPNIAVSKLVQYIKGKSSRILLYEIKSMQQKFLGRHIWAMGYFVANSGNITDEVIMEYIKNQDIKERDDDFSISE